MSNTYSKQNGFSMVELMIGLVIGLIIVMGVVTVYLGSAKSQTTNSAIIDVQNASRFAQHFLSEDIFPSGFTSICPDGEEHQLNLLNTNHARYTDALFNPNVPVMVWDTLADFQGSNELSNEIKNIISANYLRGGILLAQHASRYNEATLANDLSGGNSLTLDTAGNFPFGSVTVVSDMQRCIVFQNHSNDADTLSIDGAAIPGNRVNEFPTFDEDPVNSDIAKIFQFTSNIYFINPNSQLSRLSLTEGLDVDANDIEVLVDGIEDMRFEFGMINEDRELDSMQTAQGIHTSALMDWSDVGMLRVHILARSVDGNIIDTPTAVNQAPFNDFCEVDDDELALCQDRRLRYVFSHNLGVRNILP